MCIGQWEYVRVQVGCTIGGREAASAGIGLRGRRGSAAIRHSGALAAGSYFGRLEETAAPLAEGFSKRKVWELRRD